MSKTHNELKEEIMTKEIITSDFIDSKMNTIINADCLEVMKTIPDNYFDLVLTDPPYGIGISSNPIRQKHDKKDWDDFAPSKEHFDEIFRISKNQIIWGANYFDLPPNKCFLVWDKKQPYDFSLAMAENLVSITSIEKKMSLDIESVGGPIDVAVISKGDGFIWYKRKHYFDKEYNPHFNYKKG